jgi:hypothetical protein
VQHFIREEQVVMSPMPAAMNSLRFGAARRPESLSTTAISTGSPADGAYIASTLWSQWRPQ